MRDVTAAAIIFCVLFVFLTLPVGDGFFGLTQETSEKFHYFMSEVLFWIATFVICASATYGAFARQDRFGLSRNYPLINRILSVLLILSPFLALLYDVRFVYVLLGLLLYSHMKSKTEEERVIEFPKSRAFSNMILLALFTLALMLMNVNGYYVTNVFNFGSVNDTVPEMNTDMEEGAEA